MFLKVFQNSKENTWDSCTGLFLKTLQNFQEQLYFMEPLYQDLLPLTRAALFQPFSMYHFFKHHHKKNFKIWYFFVCLLAHPQFFILKWCKPNIFLITALTYIYGNTLYIQLLVGCLKTDPCETHRNRNIILQKSYVMLSIFTVCMNQKL